MSLKAFALILVCQLIGETVVHLAGLPFPGPVVGLGILFLGLRIHKTVPDEIGKTGDVILSYLPLLYVPALTGVIVHANRLQSVWMAVGIALLVSTALTLVITGLIMTWLGGTEAEDV